LNEASDTIVQPQDASQPADNVGASVYVSLSIGNLMTYLDDETNQYIDEQIEAVEKSLASTDAKEGYIEGKCVGSDQALAHITEHFKPRYILIGIYHLDGSDRLMWYRTSQEEMDRVLGTKKPLGR